MEVPLEAPADDVVRLRRCLSDMVGIMALPALWAGLEPRPIASALVDALFGILPLAFAFVRLSEVDAGPPIDIVRVAESPQSTTPCPEVGAILQRAFGASSLKWPARAQIRMADADLSVASVQLGVNGECGAVVVGSARRVFPEHTEQLLLEVAANQAALALHQVRLLSEQKQAARDRDSRLIVDNIPGLIALLSAAGELEVVNRQLLEYFGQTLEELKHWGTNDTVHPDDLPSVIDVFSRSVAAGRPYEILQRFKRVDGVYRWFQNRGFPVRDGNGDVTRWCVLLTDVDDRTRAEEALRESEHEARLIVDSIPGLVSVVTAGGEMERVNRRVTEYVGKSLEELQRWTTNDIVHPEDLPGANRAFGQSIASGDPADFEARLRRSDGAYRWFQIRSLPLRDRQGRIIRWYLLQTDIEDRKRAEDELRRKENFLATAQRLSLSGSFSWCLDTNEVIFSEEAYRIFGFEPASTPTIEQIDSRIHPEDRHLLPEKREAARATGEGQDYQLRLLMPDGSIKYLHTTSSEMQDANGRRQYIGALQDVTQRRLADEALNRARSELAHVSRITAIGALTASIAHEISQPLSGVIINGGTCLRMLDADPPNLDGARDTARRTIRDGNRASDVIARLRALYSKKEFTLESMDLNDATREVIALSLNDLQRNRVILQTELTSDVALVTGDRIQLQQVILNLLRNASDAMAEVQERPRHLLIRTEHEDAGSVRLTVRDTGVGLGSQSLDKLFDSFYTTKSAGMGIGLSISRAIIERHHGRLWAEHNGGPGATFAFSIPGSPEEPHGVFDV